MRACVRARACSAYNTWKTGKQSATGLTYRLLFCLTGSKNIYILKDCVGRVMCRCARECVRDEEGSLLVSRTDGHVSDR